MSDLDSDNRETLDTVATIAAMTRRPPTPWKAPKPDGGVGLEQAKWAILRTRGRAQLFEAVGVKRGVIVLKASWPDGSPQLRGPQYSLSQDDLAAPGWALYATYEQAASTLGEDK